MENLEVESSHQGGVDLNTNRHLDVELEIDGVAVAAELGVDSDAEHPDYVVGVEYAEPKNPEKTRHVLKIPRRLREAGHATIEFYENHDNLQKGVKAVSVLAGMVTVGSLVVLRLKKNRS